VKTYHLGLFTGRHTARPHTHLLCQRLPMQLSDSWWWARNARNMYSYQSKKLEKWHHVASSSSSCALQLWKSFGLLNYDLPFGAILDMFWPLNKLHLSHVFPDILPSGLGSSCWSSCEWFPFIHFLYNTCDITLVSYVYLRTIKYSYANPYVKHLLLTINSSSTQLDIYPMSILIHAS
jgi:hypothetical protein